MLVVGSHVINPVLTKSVPYDTVNDFTPITLLAASPVVLVVQKDGKYPDLETFIKMGKQADISVGYSEGATQLTGELIKQKAGIKVVPVPYKGGAPLMVDIIGGHVDSGVTSVLTALPHVKSGKLMVIGTTAEKKLDMYPNAVTFKQAGYPQVEALSWYGLFGPIESTVHLLLNVVRQSAYEEKAHAPAGYFQKALETQTPCQLIRVTMHGTPAFPEISGGKHRISIRFLTQDDHLHPVPQQDDVHFVLGCCVI